MILTLNIPVQVTIEQCQAVLTIATDTGYINYWEMPFRNRKRDGDFNCISFEVKCVDGVEPAEPTDSEWTVCDHNTVIAGLNRIIQPNALISSSIRESIVRLLCSPDDGIDFCDAEQADCILQFGLFGELVFG